MIINGSEKYNELIERMNREVHICTPIFRDIHKHPNVNKTLCVGYTFLNSDFYMVSVTHEDAVQFKEPPIVTNTITDEQINIITYLSNKHIPTIDEVYTPYVQSSNMLFNNMRDSHRIPSITNWSTVVRTYHKKILAILEQELGTKNQFISSAVRTLRRIESAGLAVDVSIFDEYFENKSSRLVTDGLVYSQYYPYTMTGRPSNRFGGINFAALNKSDGSRSAFISRFEDGKLLQLDFESYHLRLIAQYMNVPVPTEPIHQYLAKQYFGKNEITQEEYDEGKQITFGILYGADVQTDIPLLQSIKQLANVVYSNYQHSGLIAPISKRKINVPEYDITENKLFNYFVQNYEFEMTISRIESLLDYLETKESKLILYTYDAVLLDCPKTEINEIEGVARRILSDNTFPVRVYEGNNYNEMSLK